MLVPRAYLRHFLFKIYVLSILAIADLKQSSLILQFGFLNFSAKPSWHKFIKLTIDNFRVTLYRLIIELQRVETLLIDQHDPVTTCQVLFLGIKVPVALRTNKAFIQKALIRTYTVAGHGNDL